MHKRTSLMASAALVFACAAPTPGCESSSNRAPTIAVFDANPPYGEAPLSTWLYWEISDPDGDTLTCEIDINGDGRADHTIRPCTSEDTHDIVVEAPGRHTITLTVSDGKHRVVRELPVYANDCPLPSNVFYPENHPGLVEVVLNNTTTELLYDDPTVAPEVPTNTFLLGSSAGGYLRFISGEPVVSISTAGARISLLTEEMKLEDLVHNCYFGARAVPIPFTNIKCLEDCDKVESVEYLRPDGPGVKGGVSVGASFDFVDMDLGDGARFKAGLSLSAEISRFEVDISWGLLRSFTVEIKPSATGSMNLDVPLPGVSVSRDLDLGKYVLGAFPLGPVMITPVLELEGGVSLGIEPKYKIGASITVSAVAGFTWYNDADMESWFSASVTPGIIDPKFEVGIGSARASLKPKVGLMLYGLAGPTLGLEVYAKASATADFIEGEVCVNAKAGLNLVLGAEVDLFLVSFGTEWSHNLAEIPFYNECFGGSACGNGECDEGEDCIGCPADCGDCPTNCGDGTCDEDEDCALCPADCGSCPANCGDGVKDFGETCDPPESCPTDCDDGDPCTQDSLSGSAASCNVQCVNELILECIDGDGCCAVGCGQGDDDDCSATCDDGVVDPGEYCDPISECPTSCSPMSGCTMYTLLGSASNCTARCAESQQTSCVHNDGCCPVGQGCVFSNDNDCSPVCGDGICEGSETTTSCATDCDSDNYCVGETGWFCGGVAGFGGVGGTLYHCLNGLTEGDYECTFGCEPAPAGQPDDCATSPQGEYADSCGSSGDPVCGATAPHCIGGYCCIGSGGAEPGDFCGTGDDCCSGHCGMASVCCWNDAPPGCII
jgi:hypothetical protein